MEKRRDRRTSNSTRNQIEIQPNHCTYCTGGEQLVRNCNKAKYTVLGNKSVTGDVLSTTMCIVEQTFNARQLTPVSSDVKDLEALTPNHFLLGSKNVQSPYLPCAKKFVAHQKLFQDTEA